MPSSNTRHGLWLFAFFTTLGCFIIANLVAAHLKTDAGLLEGLGVVDHASDDIRRLGFPFQFYEEGGYAHREIFSFTALFSDVLLGIGTAIGAGFVTTWLANRRNSITNPVEGNGGQPFRSVSRDET